MVAPRLGCVNGRQVITSSLARAGPISRTRRTEKWKKVGNVPYGRGMACEGPTGFTRRDALRRLLGGGVRERRRVVETVEAYRALLREVARDLPFGVALERLPAPPGVVGEALVEAARRSLLNLPRRTLRDAYASLAHFRDPSELEPVHAARVDVERRDPSPEASRRIERSLEIRRRWLDERVLREREFEARFPGRPGR